MKLTPRQHEIWQFLKSEEIDNKKLGDYYLGTLYALQNHENPDKHAQAANSLVEILENLYKTHPDAIEKQSYKDTLENINKSLAKKNRCELTKGELLEILDEIEKHVAEGNRMPSRAKQMVMMFGEGADHKLWRKLEEIKHHHQNCNNVDSHLKTLEDMLLEYQDKMTISDQQKIKKLAGSCRYDD